MMTGTHVLRSVGVGLCLLALCFPGCRTTTDMVPPSSTGGHATLILDGGKIWTGNPEQPEAEAIAIVGHRITVVGSDARVLTSRGPDTRTIDLRGRRVVPGFIDAHLHFLSGGDELLAPDLRSATSEEEFAGRLGAAAARLPEGTWITAGAWDHENWPGARLPTRTPLDRATPKHPVFVSRLDGHMAVANSLALELAGVTRDTADPAGGTIVRDPTSGEPTGVLKDNAMSLVHRVIPPPTKEQLLTRARAALRHAAELGVTGVHDMLDSYDAIEIYQELKARGELTTRVTLYTPIASHARWASVEVRRGFGDRFLKLNGLKAFADGSLGSSTALFFDPYVNLPSTRGLAVTDLSPGGTLDTQVRDGTTEGLQIATHAIGDRANHLLLDIYERVGADKAGERRFRIEHAQHIHPDDLDRFAALDVIASMQPTHAIDDGRWAEKRIGPTRCETTYAFRDLLDRGARLAFGTDWPVAPLSPLLGLYAAVTRATVDGKHPEGWIPRQKIGVEDALRAYTIGSAVAGFAESEVGTLEEGKLADLVVLERDILSIDPADLRDVKVAMTIVDGNVVFKPGEDEGP